MLYYTLKRKPGIRGLIASSPGLAPGTPVETGKLLAIKALNVLAPSLTLTNGLDRTNLSHDPEVEKIYAGDLLVHPMISTRLAMSLIANGEWMQANKNPFPVPLLLQQGTDDHLVSPTATRRFATGLIGDVTYKEWQGWYHELHNEVNKQEVIQGMIAWLDLKLS